MRTATGTIQVQMRPPVRSDKDIADIARISFSRKAEEFSDSANSKLIGFLAREKHWSPFGHCYYRFRTYRIEPKSFLNLISEVGSQGISFTFDSYGMSTITVSIWKIRDILKFLKVSNLNTHPDLSKVFASAVSYIFDGLEISKARLFEDFQGSEIFDIEEVRNIDDAKIVSEGTLKEDLGFIEKHLYFTFDCKTPMFVARQLGKHQVDLCWNEESRRYIDSEPELYFFPELRARPESSIKQGSGTVLENSGDLLELVNGAWAWDTLSKYEYLLSKKVAPEQARALLDQRMMVSWCWTGNLKAIKRILNQRLYKNAQKETRTFATLLAEKFMETYEAHGVPADEIRGLLTRVNE